VDEPCKSDTGYCLLIDHWEGCWKHGHEQPDKSMCPRTAKAFNAIWVKICDDHIARGRRNARRTDGADQGSDERPRRVKAVR